MKKLARETHRIAAVCDMKLNIGPSNSSVRGVDQHWYFITREEFGGELQLGLS